MGFNYCNVTSYEQDSVWSWFIGICATICMILTIGFAFAMGVLFPVLMDSFHESRERTAWTTAVIIGIFTFLGPFTSAFLNRFGIRISTVLGCLMCAAGLAMGSFVPSIFTLYVAFSVPFAVGLSLIYISSPIIVTHYFIKRRSIALGLVTAGQGLGTMILGPTLQVLAEALEWRNTFRVFAGILALASLTGCFLYQGKSSRNEHEESPSKNFELNLSLLKNPVLLILMLIRGLLGFSRLVPYVHLAKHCDDLGIPADKSAILFLFLGIFATLGRLGGGLLCNLNCIKTKLLLQGAAFVMGASTMIMTLAKSYGALVAYAIVFSLADGMSITTFVILCFNSVEQSKIASAYGFTLISSGVFATGGPPLAGFMADKLGNYFAAFLLAGAVGVLTAIILLSFLCIKKKAEEITADSIDGADVHELKSDIAVGDLHLQQQCCKDEVALYTDAKTTVVKATSQSQVPLILLMETAV